MALEGLLKDVQLSSVLAVLARGEKTGAITLIDGNQDGIIYISDGIPVHAVLDREEGNHALEDLLSWRTGKFFFEENIHGAAETISEELQRSAVGLPEVKDRSMEVDGEGTGGDTPLDLLGIFHQVLEHSTQGISSVAVARPRDGEILACSSLLESDRALTTQATHILKLLEGVAVEVGRGGLDQITLLDSQGWFIALRLKGDLYLVCTAAKRAKLGQLLFHLKRICAWVTQLEL